MNPSHRSSNSPQVIRLAPARSGGSPVSLSGSLARRIERIAALIGATALIALAGLAGVCGCWVCCFSAPRSPKEWMKSPALADSGSG